MQSIKKISALAASCALALASGGLYAQDPPSAEGGSFESPEAKAAPAPDKESPEARKLLMDMAKFLSQSQKFSFNATAAYDTVQPNGQKIEFVENRSFQVQRPNQLRATVEQSDGDYGVAYFDGKQISAYSETRNVYAQADAPGTLDETVAHFMKNMRMKLPMAAFLVNKSPEALEKRVKSIDYVEDSSILGMPAAHLAGRTDTVDFEIWIQTGTKQPVPRRVVLTYRNAEGAPQYRAQFSDWNFAPKFKADTFTFTPPKDAQKISFLTQVKQGPNVAPGGTP
jgi:hypothetical protein